MRGGGGMGAHTHTCTLPTEHHFQGNPRVYTLVVDVAASTEESEVLMYTWNPVEFQEVTCGFWNLCLEGLYDHDTSPLGATGS